MKNVARSTTAVYKKNTKYRAQIKVYKAHCSFSCFGIKARHGSNTAAKADNDSGGKTGRPETSA
jgi:hypothetical protein